MPSRLWCYTSKSAYQTCNKPVYQSYDHALRHQGTFNSGISSNIKMRSYTGIESHHIGKKVSRLSGPDSLLRYRLTSIGNTMTILRPSYLHNGISYSGKTTSSYWIGALNIYTGNRFIWGDGLYIDRLVVVANHRDLYKPVMIQIQRWSTVINWHLLSTELRWLDGRGIPLAPFTNMV